MKKTLPTFLFFILLCACTKNDFWHFSNFNKNMIARQDKMNQDDTINNDTNYLTPLIISNSPLLQFTPDTIYVAVGSEVQFYSNINQVYNNHPNAYGEWRSWNLSCGQITQLGGTLMVYNSGIIRIIYTCGVIGSALPNYQKSIIVVSN